MNINVLMNEVGLAPDMIGRVRMALKNTKINGQKLLSDDGNIIPDQFIDNAITLLQERFPSEIEQGKKLKEAYEAYKEEQNQRSAELAKILVTSGYNFEGYKITRYSGYISGDDAVSVDRGFAGYGRQGTDVGEYLLKSLTVIRQNALRELKEAADALGCNAVIGVDFDYITLDPETANSTGGTTYYPYVFCVTANGTAVEIEKE